jgi:transposase
MSMGKRRSKQSSMWVAGSHVRGPGHRFYEALNKLLAKAKFDQRVEELCAPYYESDGTVGRPSIPPGTYFRMLLVGYFEGIDSGRGLEWSCPLRERGVLARRRCLDVLGHDVPAEFALAEAGKDLLDR